MEMQVNSQLIRSEREKRAWSQSHLAEVSGLGSRTVQRIEADGRASYESASAIATAFSLDVSALLVADADSISAPRPAANGGMRVTVAVAAAALIASLVWILDASLWEPAPPSAEANLVEFSELRTVNQLEAMLAEARAEGRPVMIYVTAEWCVSCRTIEAQTLSDSAVFAASEPFLALRADVTGDSDDDKALLSALGAFGPPTIAFFDGTGAAGRPVVGFVSSDEVRNRLTDIAAM